jgi:arylsulfatase A-like enzyme
MENAGKPNILFILSDQHNAKFLGKKNHPDVLTPNLDRLCDEGVRFENAISQNPICTPSRMCWYSGQYCHNHGYYGLEGPNPGGLPNIFAHLRKRGYRTGAMGKIHCPEYWIEDSCDVFLESNGNSIGGISPERADYLKENGLEGKDDHCALKEWGKKGVQTVDARPSNLNFEDSQEGWLTNKAIQFMGESTEQKRPFMLHISFPKPHQCYAPSPQFWDMYNEDLISLPPNADYEMHLKAPHLVETAAKWKQGDWVLFEPNTFKAARKRKMHGYLGCVSQVDHAVGQLLSWLDKEGLRNETIIIYSSDHGDYGCEHGIMEKSPGICSDAITRVPCIWSWKNNCKEGHTADEIVESVDLVNTLCSLAHIEPMITADGKDFSQLLKGKAGQIHRIGVTENVWSKSVRKGKYRFVYYPPELFRELYPNGFGELYDLENDKWEMNNLYFDHTYKKIVSEMKDELFNWIVTTKRPVTLLPAVKKRDKQYMQRYNNSINQDGKVNAFHVKNAGNKKYI